MEEILHQLIGNCFLFYRVSYMILLIGRFCDFGDVFSFSGKNTYEFQVK